MTGQKANTRSAGTGRILKAATRVLALVLTLAILTASTGCGLLSDLWNSYFSYDRPHVKFSNMKYERPDAEDLIRKIGEAAQQITENTVSFDTQLRSISALNTPYVEFYTMYELAQIRFTMNPQDASWAEENAYFDEMMGSFRQEMEKLYVACAQSPNCSRFEQEMFGEGSLEPYKDGGLITDRMAELIQQEATLVSDYYSYDTTAIEFAFDGRTGTIYDHFETVSDDRLDALYTEFYKQLNAELASAFIDLVKTRKAIAAEAGYDSYIDYVYNEMLMRDYTPADAEALLGAITDNIVPLYRQAVEAGKIRESIDLPQYSEGQILDAARSVLGRLDTAFTKILDYMDECELLYLGYVGTQADVSFTTYIDKYDAPFILIRGEGDLYDLITFVHEFGHFTDAYLNYNSNTVIDQSEISSQALEYLFLNALTAADLGLADANAADLLRESKKLDTLFLYLIQGIYYYFETAVYALPDEELTVSAVNAIFKEALPAFALEDYYSDIEYAWVTVPHFYEQAFYTVSYITSNSAALALAEAEQETPGSGTELYFKLLDWDYTASFVDNIARVGIASPFSEEGINNLTAIMRKLLGV